MVTDKSGKIFDDRRKNDKKVDTDRRIGNVKKTCKTKNKGK